jgi:hypothetical protein
MAMLDKTFISAPAIKYMQAVPPSATPLEIGKQFQPSAPWHVPFRSPDLESPPTLFLSPLGLNLLEYRTIRFLNEIILEMQGQYCYFNWSRYIFKQG